MLYRRSPPTPPRRLLQIVAVSGAATILGFTACSSGQLASTGDAGDEQGGSSGASGSNGGSSGTSGSTSGSGGFSGSNGGCAGSCGLLDAADDAIEASASDAAVDVADESADAATLEGGSE